MDSLPRGRYARAFEIGCSIGVLTSRLAGRCDSLLSVDVSDLALRRAERRNADHSHVRFELMGFPADSPPGPFDLIVMSEVGYYLSRPDLERAAVRCRDLLEPGGDLLLVHYVRETDYPLTGDAVHDFLLARDGFDLLSDRPGADYRLSMLRRHG